jgi:hypothetical protein
MLPLHSHMTLHKMDKSKEYRSSKAICGDIQYKNCPCTVRMQPAAWTDWGNGRCTKLHMAGSTDAQVSNALFVCIQHISHWPGGHVTILSKLASINYTAKRIPSALPDATFANHPDNLARSKNSRRRRLGRRIGHPAPYPSPRAISSSQLIYSSVNQRRENDWPTSQTGNLGSMRSTMQGEKRTLTCEQSRQHDAEQCARLNCLPSPFGRMSPCHLERFRVYFVHRVLDWLWFVFFFEISHLVCLTWAPKYLKIDLGIFVITGSAVACWSSDTLFYRPGIIHCNSRYSFLVFPFQIK